MTAFLGILKNDWYRLLEEKGRMLLMQVLVLLAIVAAVFMSTRPVTAGHIALVAPAGAQTIESPYLSVTRLAKAPPLSALVAGTYDAVVMLEDGKTDIATIKNDAFRETLQRILDDPTGAHEQHLQTRGMGTSIMGYLVMFIMMQGNFLQFFFAEDRERGQLRRVAATPVSFGGYLLAHCLFAFLALYVPTVVLLYAVRVILGVQMGLTMWQCACLLALICALAIAFPLFLHAVFRTGDQASMYGSAIVMLTSILAGSFYGFEEGNAALQSVSRVLPQKSFLSIVQAVEGGSGLRSVWPHLLYIALLTVVLLTAGVLHCKRGLTRAR